MNPPSVWTDQILWRRTVQENSLSRRVRTKWAWNTISLHSSSAGHKPNHQQPSEKKREINVEARSTSLPNTSGIMMLMPEDALFSPETQNPTVCLVPAAPDPWNVPCRAPGKPAPPAGLKQDFRHFYFVTEEAWDELSTTKEPSWVLQEYFAFLYNTSTFNEVNPSGYH